MAEKMILAMMQNGKWWQCFDSEKNALVKKAFEWADVFIAKQEEHHRKMPFRDEFRQILDEEGVYYNEQYIFNDPV